MTFHVVNTKLRWLLESERPREGEVLVLPANDHLWMGFGPGLALRKELGKEIELEAARLGPLEPGQLAGTGGANSGFRWLYHAVVTRQDLHWVDGSAAPAVGAVLARAAKDGCTQIVAYPLYRGTHGDRMACAREMLQAYLTALEAGSSVREVIVLAENAEERALFQDLVLQLLRQG